MLVENRFFGRAYRVAIASFPWHAVQVLGMFFTYTFDWGSVIFVIECSPWQSVHTGDSAIPARIPFPCTARSYSSRIPEWHIPFWAGSPYFSPITLSSWHFRQTSTMLSRKVLAFGSCALRMACLPWQSSHPGTSFTPFACTIPWVLWEYDFCASAWHLPHAAAASFACGTFASAWHDMHVPLPRTDCRNSFSSPNSDCVFPPGRDFSIVLSPWYSWRSPTVGPSSAVAARATPAAAR